jgi:hypothetical protein
MAEAVPQTYQNHTRLVPAYHFVAFFILIVNFVWSAYKAVRYFSLDSFLGLLVAAALLIIWFYARIFAIRLQDRIIRLEMRLRLEKLLPADLRSRIPQLTLDQLIALRFASDEELPELARKVLAENIALRAPIKQMVRNWTGDYLRV